MVTAFAVEIDQLSLWENGSNLINNGAEKDTFPWRLLLL
jgi:hypothetical protein